MASKTPRKSAATSGSKTTVAKKGNGKPTAASTGVPAAYLGEAGNFRPGMDARYKSDLILAITGGTKGELERRLVTFTKADAQKRLTKRGWGAWLVKRQSALARKAGKASKAA